MSCEILTMRFSKYGFGVTSRFWCGGSLVVTYLHILNKYYIILNKYYITLLNELKLRCIAVVAPVLPTCHCRDSSAVPWRCQLKLLGVHCSLHLLHWTGLVTDDGTAHLLAKASSVSAITVWNSLLVCQIPQNLHTMSQIMQSQTTSCAKFSMVSAHP